MNVGIMYCPLYFTYPTRKANEGVKSSLQLARHQIKSVHDVIVKFTSSAGVDITIELTLTTVQYSLQTAEKNIPLARQVKSKFNFVL